MRNELTLLVGTYTANTASQGIYAMTGESKGLEQSTTQYIHARNPSFLATLPAKGRLYYVEEIGNNQGMLKSAKIASDFSKTIVDFETPTLGSSPCHIAISPQEDLLVVCNYSSSSFTCFALDTEGQVTKQLSNYTFQGSSVHPQRQQRPHIHSACFSPDGSRVFIQDLGTDRIYQFHTDDVQRDNQKYTSYTLQGGSGPRHMAISSQRRAYVINELGGDIEVLLLDSSYTIQSSIQKTTLQDSYPRVGVDMGAHIRLSYDERFLYASNRGDRNEISVYAVGQDGLLQRIQVISSMGIGPRHFEFSANQHYLYVGNQRSNVIQEYTRDENTGLLQPTSTQISIPSPVFIGIL